MLKTKKEILYKEFEPALEFVNNRIYVAMQQHKPNFQTILDYNLDNKRNVVEIEEKCELTIDLIDLVASIN